MINCFIVSLFIPKVHQLGEYKRWLSKPIPSEPSSRRSLFHMSNKWVCGWHGCAGCIHPLLLLYTCKYCQTYYLCPLLSSFYYFIVINVITCPCFQCQYPLLIDTSSIQTLFRKHTQAFTHLLIRLLARTLSLSLIELFQLIEIHYKTLFLSTPFHGSMFTIHAFLLGTNRA